MNVDIDKAVNATGLSSEAIDQLLQQAERGRASKRAKLVLRTLLEQGECSTEALAEAGYKHAPRAVRDLKDAGIDVQMELRVPEGGDRRIGHYRLTGRYSDLNSRKPLSKSLQTKVLSEGKCRICGSYRRLQVDHKIPFAIGGEIYPHDPAEFMPLCPSCNRAKSWDCEHNCSNWGVKDPDFCRACYWSGEPDYRHVAGHEVRNIRVQLSDPEEVESFDKHGKDPYRVVRRGLGLE